MRGISQIASRIRKGESGFSFAELVIGITLFTAAVLGLSSMLLSGGSLIGRSAMANSAMRLASDKLERVKSMPFYVPWRGQDADIDDSYWRYKEDGTALENEYQLDLKGHPGKDEPTDEPSTGLDSKYETYGQIPGFPSYKRTTAIQYVYVKTVGGITELAPALMNENVTWVPKDPQPGEDDEPIGGESHTSTDLLHMLMVEVNVSYMDAGVERIYTERGLVSDLTSTGGSLNQVLVVKSIEVTVPTGRDLAWGYRGKEIVQCKIEVEAPELAVGDVVEVTLWRSGVYDIGATGEAVTNPSTIICSFDLTNTTDPDPQKYRPPGFYNLTVNFLKMGFIDKSLRSCFELRDRIPTITDVKTVGNEAAWGFQAQTARQLSVTGTCLYGTPIVELKNGSGGLITGDPIFTSPDGTTLLATFNLSGNWGPNTKWALEVNTGTFLDPAIAIKADCFTMNPEPVIKGVSDTGVTDGVEHFDWAYSTDSSRYVKLTGEYLYGFEDVIPLNSVIYLRLADVSDHWCPAIKLVHAEESSNLDVNKWKKETWVIMEFNPSDVHNGGFDTQPSKCSVKGKNYGSTLEFESDHDDDTQNVLMNP